MTRTEGDKAAAILEAEGRFEASKRDAEAKKRLAASTNSKLVVLPADLPAAVRGF